MNKIFKSFGYLSYALAFILLAVLISYLEKYFKTHLTQFLGHFVYINLSFMTVYPIILGLIIGLPSFIKKMKKRGHWEYNWLKLVFIGLPSLIFATLHLFYWFPVFSIVTTANPYFLYLVQPVVITASGILLGYTLISCFNKKSKH